MEFINLVLLGFATGIISSYFGIGGAAVIVPVLYHTYPQLNALTVIGCSLGVILLNASFNTFLFYKSGIQLNKKIFMPLIPTIVLGAFSGTYLATLISDIWLKRIFALVLLLVALKTLLLKLPRDSKVESSPNTTIGVIIGYFVGLITGVTGLGGGTVLAPTFLVLYKMRPRFIPAYNNLLMIVASCAALMSFLLTPYKETFSIFPAFQIGQTNWAIIIIIFIGSIFTSKLGVWLNERTTDSRKKFIFVALLTVLAANLIFNS
ncbi:MAG: sulfite exporter TauE/SafE family protein [Bdellovibrionales bacterium]|nr:sulfite exporter TauE/SafE family protein [Bdellovibrionales bacterium]